MVYFLFLFIDLPSDSLGDGISFPQRHMDEDEDSLLGWRGQRWADDGVVENNTRTDANPYREFLPLFKNYSVLTLNILFSLTDVVNLDPLVQAV